MNETEESPAWVAQLGACLGNHHESMLSVADAMIIELPRLMARIDEALSNENHAEIRRLGHTLKSSLKYVATSEDVDHATALELAGKESRIDDARDSANRLEGIVQEWMTRLRDWLSSQG